MILFEVRNYMSILMAKQIIEERKIQEYNFFIPYNSIEYLNKLKKILNISEDRIISFNTSVYFTHERNRYKLAEKELKEKCLKKEFDEIYLCNIYLIEKHLYKLFKQKNKKINFFEEGINCYFEYFGKENLKKWKIKSKIRVFLDNIFSPKFNSIFFTEFIYNEVILNFPKAYSYDNYKKINEIKLSFNLENKRKNIENLFLTRPLSEDDILDEKSEINLIISYIINTQLKSITFKHHPRESAKKLEILKSKLKKMGIKVTILIDDCPAEELIKYYDIKKIIGFETGTIIYLSQIYGIKADCLLKSTVEKSKSSYLRSFYEFYKENFKEINYI